jgi:hypothetical protein
MGPRAGLDAVEKRKIPSPRRESNLRTPIVHPVASRYAWNTLALQGGSRGQGPPKRWYPTTTLHGVTNQKTSTRIWTSFRFLRLVYEGVSKSFWTESITKYTLTFGIAPSEATQRVMAAKHARLTHRIAIQLHLVAESYTISSSRSRRPVRELLDTPSYWAQIWNHALSTINRSVQSLSASRFFCKPVSTS